MTRKTFAALALIAAAATPLAGVANAQGFSSGADQLAASVGVESGVYSLSQLATLASLMADDNANQAQIDFILNNPQGTDAPVTRAAANLNPDSVTPVRPSLSGNQPD